MYENERYIKISLEDHIVKSVDENGDEKLRLAITIDDCEIFFRFPTLNKWDFYVSDTAKLLIMLAQTAGDIELNMDLVPEEHFQDWAYIIAQSLNYKKCSDLIVKIITEYLRPEIILPDNVSIDDHIESPSSWLMSHMDMSQIFYLFVAILHIDEWLKKKSAEIVRKIFPKLITAFSRDTLPKNSTSPFQTSKPGPSYVFD